ALIAAGACTAADVRKTASLEEGYTQMYNLQFEDAHRTIREWEAAHPASPLGPVSDAAAYLFSEFDSLHVLQWDFFSENDKFLNMHKLTPDPQVKRDFDNALDQARSLETSPGQAASSDP